MWDVENTVLRRMSNVEDGIIWNVEDNIIMLNVKTIGVCVVRAIYHRNDDSFIASTLLINIF